MTKDRATQLEKDIGDFIQFCGFLGGFCFFLTIMADFCKMMLAFLKNL